jgi:undecaprenyl-diphosphatase
MTRGWLYRREVVGIALSLAAVVLLTWQVTTGGPVVRLDHRVYAALGADSTPLVNGLTDLGSVPVCAVLLTVAAVDIAMSLRRWWPVLLAAGNSLAMTVVVLGLKAAVGRTGPGLSALNGYPGYFPSGHTATAAVCLGTASYIVVTARRQRRRQRAEPGVRGDASGLATLAGLALAVLVGSMTVVSGNHWVSDVVAGLAVSAIVLIVGFATMRPRLERE